MKNKTKRYISVALSLLVAVAMVTTADSASAHSRYYKTSDRSAAEATNSTLKPKAATPVVTPVVTTSTTTTHTTTATTATVNQTPIIAGAYYVSKTGSDTNAGSLTSPWKTIQKAANAVKAGDTVYIKGGTYNERVTLKTSGTSGNFITFSNYPGESPIIDGTGISWGYNWNCLFDTDRQDYIKVKGLGIANSVWAGIGDESDSNGSQHVIIENCYTYNTRASGIAFYNCEDITLDNNTVEKANMAYLTGVGCQEAISLSNVDTFTAKNNTIKNITNNIQGLGGEGFDAKEGSSDGKIYNNTIHNVAKMAIYIDSYSQTENNIEVYNNTIYDCGMGIVTAAEKGGLLSNVNIHDNTIKNCKDGILVADWGQSGYSHPIDTITINKNTLSGIPGRTIKVFNSEAKNVIITNNIII